MRRYIQYSNNSRVNNKLYFDLHSRLVHVGTAYLCAPYMARICNYTRWVTGALGFQNDFISGVMLRPYMGHGEINVIPDVDPFCRRLVRSNVGSEKQNVQAYEASKQLLQNVWEQWRLIHDFSTNAQLKMFLMFLLMDV